MNTPTFNIGHRDSFEKNGKWSLVRKSLNIKSFGINMVTIPPGDTIPEHTEVDRDQEELFIILKGTGTMVIDGKEYDAPEGTYIRLDPELKRTVKNKSSEPVVVLIVSAPRSSGYVPMDWA